MYVGLHAFRSCRLNYGLLRVGAGVVTNLPAKQSASKRDQRWQIESIYFCQRLQKSARRGKICQIFLQFCQTKSQSHSICQTRYEQELPAVKRHRRNDGMSRRVIESSLSVLLLLLLFCFSLTHPAAASVVFICCKNPEKSWHVML